MIAYFKPTSLPDALAIARKFGLTRPDSNGDEQLTSTHHGSAIWHTVGDGRFVDGDGNRSQRLVKLLIIQVHNAKDFGKLQSEAGKTAAPRGHRI